MHMAVDEPRDGDLAAHIDFHLATIVPRVPTPSSKSPVTKFSEFLRRLRIDLWPPPISTRRTRDRTLGSGA